MKRVRWVPLLLAPLLLDGCSAIGGLTQSLGSLLSLVIGLALVAAPFALSYWLYKK